MIRYKNTKLHDIGKQHPMEQHTKMFLIWGEGLSEFTKKGPAFYF